MLGNPEHLVKQFVDLSVACGGRFCCWRRGRGLSLAFGEGLLRAFGGPAATLGVGAARMSARGGKEGLKH
jgi:hypothetical protein